MGPKRLFLCSHPAHFRHVLTEAPERYVKGLGLAEARPLLGDGLLSSQDPLAAAQRERLQEAFRGGRLKDFGSVMSAAIQRMVEDWRPVAAGGRPVDLQRETAILTLGILGATLLSVDLRSRAEQVSSDLATLGRWAIRRMASLVRLPMAVPTPGNLRAGRALRRLESLAEEILRSHGGDGRSGGLLLDLLLGASPGEGADRRLAKDQILTFLLAGHETTAATLVWTWSLLAAHPEVQEWVHEEVGATLAGRLPEPADLGSLVRVRATVQEAVRLYPPVWLIPRRAVAADELDGHEIQPGSDVLLCVYNLHRHPDHWPEPNRFRPERFLEGPGAQAPSAYLPFGAGARACLGSRFSVMEAGLAVAAVAQRYRLEAQSAAAPTPEASLTLRPAAPVWMLPREWPG